MITVTRSFDPEGGYELTQPSGFDFHFFTMQSVQDYLEMHHPGEPVQWNIHEES